MRRGVGSALAAAALLLALCAGGARADARPQVTVIGDSVLTAILWNQEPLATLAKGLDMKLDVGVCRTLNGESCPYEGGRVPTLMDVVAAHGDELGRTVLVEVGYNDRASTFADAVEQSIQALLAAGVQRILWANLHGFSQQWLDMNAVLDAAAHRHPEVTVIDWEHYSFTQWSWFQGDGIHLVHEGAMAMAGLFHDALLEAVHPLTVAPVVLPVAHAGRPYSARLKARGGIAPYTWRLVAGRLPRGLSLRATGLIAGRPQHGGRIDVVVRALDAKGHSATRRL